MTATPPGSAIGCASAAGEQIYLLDNPVQPYAWGSTTVIPDLLGLEPTGAPAAELWIGAHPVAPSRVAGPAPARTLSALIDEDPTALLGAAVEQRFGQLPYLLKVLAVAHPLSLQAHPSLAQARAGYAAEDAAGIARDAPERNYRDANHKPEQVCALTEFDGLCGFRPVVRTAEFLAELGLAESGTPRLTALTNRLLGPDGLSEVVTDLLTVDADSITQLLDELIPAAERVHREGGVWAPEAGWIVRLNGEFPSDRGTVIATLLNLVHLRPGEALFLHAGELHAYLGGVAVEVLANSDNVLRGGLTPKHIDVTALLAILDLSEEPVEPIAVERAGPSGHGCWYPSAVPDFQLGRFEVSVAEPAVLAAGGPRILLCTDGAATLTAAKGQPVALPRGAAAFVPAGAEVGLCVDGGSTAVVFAVRANL